MDRPPVATAAPCCGPGVAAAHTEAVAASVTAVACAACGTLWLQADEQVRRVSVWASMLAWCAHVAPLWGHPWSAAMTEQ
jgi:hypothetical protein